MSYVAIKGGGRAIAGSAAVTEFLRTEEALAHPEARPLELDAVLHQLRHLVDRVVSEGGVYHPRFAALAIKQSLGTRWKRPSRCAPGAPRVRACPRRHRSTPRRCV